MDRRAIGVFDSGLGGLSVVRHLSERLPHEHIVYFGDTGRIPYGTRSPETIERYARQDCRFLLNQDVKCIIAACGTVSSVADSVLQQLPVPAMGVVRSTAQAALRATQNGRIGVLGTSATVRSGSFCRELTAHRPDAQVFATACPLFVSLVESGWIERDNTAAIEVAKRYLQPFIEQQVDTVILGCTHFPLLAPILSDLLGDTVKLIDSGACTARACAELLTQTDALNDQEDTGECRFFVSDRPSDFSAVAERFLGKTVKENVILVNVEKIEQ